MEMLRNKEELNIEIANNIRESQSKKRTKAQIIDLAKNAKAAMQLSMDFRDEGKLELSNEFAFNATSYLDQIIASQ